LLPVPSPNKPVTFCPQQYAAPLVTMPQVAQYPALRTVKLRPPDTAPGSGVGWFGLLVVDPLPSSP
jgi:hypothetical protein